MIEDQRDRRRRRARASRSRGPTSEHEEGDGVSSHADQLFALHGGRRQRRVASRRAITAMRAYLSVNITDAGSPEPTRVSNGSRRTAGHQRDQRRRYSVRDYFVASIAIASPIASCESGRGAANADARQERRFLRSHQADRRTTAGAARGKPVVTVDAIIGGTSSGGWGRRVSSGRSQSPDTSCSSSYALSLASPSSPRSHSPPHRRHTLSARFRRPRRFSASSRAPTAICRAGSRSSTTSRRSTRRARASPCARSARRRSAGRSSSPSSPTRARSPISSTTGRSSAS